MESQTYVYQVSTEDRTINPDLERFLAKRMNARPSNLIRVTCRWYLTAKEIADLILRAGGRKHPDEGEYSDRL